MVHHVRDLKLRRRVLYKEKGKECERKHSTKSEDWKNEACQLMDKEVILRLNEGYSKHKAMLSTALWSRAHARNT